MASSRCVIPILSCALWSCAPADVEDRRLRVLATCTPETLKTALGQNTAATLVVALGCDVAEVQAATSAAGRAQPPFVVVVAGAPGDRPLPDAWVEATSGGAVAVDLTLLAHRGAAPAGRRYEIGARTWTPANRAAGGELTVAPADPILALLQGQLAAARATPPQQAERVRVVFWTGDADARREAAALAEVRAAAGRDPRIELIERTELAGCAELGAQAILLATQAPERTQLATREANLTAQAALPVFALDPLLQDVPGASCVGCSPDTIARAAAAQLRALLPEGGGLLICCPEDTDDATAAQRSALLAALAPDLQR